MDRLSSSSNISALSIDTRIHIRTNPQSNKLHTMRTAITGSISTESMFVPTPPQPLSRLILCENVKGYDAIQRRADDDGVFNECGNKIHEDDDDVLEREMTCERARRRVFADIDPNRLILIYQTILRSEALYLLARRTTSRIERSSGADVQWAFAIAVERWRFSMEKGPLPLYLFNDNQMTWETCCIRDDGDVVWDLHNTIPPRPLLFSSWTVFISNKHQIESETIFLSRLFRSTNNAGG